MKCKNGKPHDVLTPKDGKYEQRGLKRKIDISYCIVCNQRVEKPAKSGKWSVVK